MIDSFQNENRFLSNFWLVPIVYEKATYASVEHAYQASKTLDPLERKVVQACETPGAAKRVGQTVTKRADWEDVKLGIMESLVRQKFMLHADLRDRLLATGSDELVEGNNWGDKFWGVCRGSGKNHLGKILMKVRSELFATNWNAQVKPI